MSGVTLEEMGSKLTSFESKLDTFIASTAKTANEHDKTDKEKETAAIKKANDEKEEEKKEAKRASLQAAIKKANDEDTPEKKDAAIKKAMSDYGHEDKDKKEAMTEDEKDEKVQVAAIITDKKIDIDNQILRVAAVSNPVGLAALKAELEKGSFTASKKMYEDMEKMLGKGTFQGNIPTNTITAPPPFFMAEAINPQNYDNIQLNANSSLSEFAKLSSKDLLEGKTA